MLEHSRSADTGLPSWDRAKFSHRPSLSHVVPMTDGFGFLCQHDPLRSDGHRHETVVPPARQLVLLTWRGNAEVQVALGSDRLKALRFRPNGAMVVPFGASSRWIAPSSAQDRCVHLHFDETELRATAAREEVGWPEFEGLVTEEGDANLARLVDLAFDEAVCEGGPSALAWQSLALLVHLHVLRGRSAARRRSKGGLSGWQLRRVTGYMRDHLAEDVALADIAAVARLSPYHFCRVFKQATGLPPHRWLQTARVERAKELLAQPGCSVIEAAGAVGYDNPGHFARVFRRETGVNPREFKRQVG